MAVVQAEVFYPGAVPDSLATVFAQNEATGLEGIPNKRRKVTPSGPKSLRFENGVTDTGIPRGYIPLARFNLRVKFAEANPALGEPSSSATDLSDPLPVLLDGTKNIRDSSSRYPSHSVDTTPYDRFNLELGILPKRNVILSERSTDPEIIEFGNNLGFAQRFVCADRYHARVPPVCHQATLYLLSDNKSFHLETVILWQDSLEIPSFNKLDLNVLILFSRYVLQEPEKNLRYHLPRSQRYEYLRTPEKYWSPRDFYDNVHVPHDTSRSSAQIKCDTIKCQLYPFQRRAVRWLLQRENMEIQPDGRVIPVERRLDDRLPVSFQRFTDADGRVYFASHLFLVIATDISGWYDAEKSLKGGILAEEMGLGKTVEMISLISLNRRSLLLEAQDPGIDSDGSNPRPSGATLIITPPAILEQWKQEFELHAPGLHVLHYTGIQRHQELSDEKLIELLANYDVVLTTYNVISREIHYASDAPKRNLRHEKRFEARKTPLVRISWWRVCLDEAQMIENGVSNAAKVARLIPRQISWAVTGTPLRKDISDLYGLLLFLHCWPLCDAWERLCGFSSVLSHIVNTIALRHSKDHVRSELSLPPQKRVVITVPFNAVEEQHYAQLHEEMSADCGLDISGAPLIPNWKPNDAITEKMRIWLTRLRQTCLHPEVSGSNRRALGTGDGPLRSVAEVLEVMIDQNDTLIRTEERALLLSQLRRGQLLENATRGREALALWMASLERASEIVKECRSQLRKERTQQRMAATGSDQDTASVDSSGYNDVEEPDKNSRIGTYRQRLRAALEIEHICIFFTGNAYYQIKTDSELTAPGSEEFKALEKREEEAYEAAKLIRKEMLAEISQKVDRYMMAIKNKDQRKEFVHIPLIKTHLYNKGLESRRVLDKLEGFCEAMNRHADQYNEWRNIMIKLLSQSLIDQEENSELEGNEYEKSTKHQEEMYVYMEALRAMFADRHDALTGQKNVLIAHEVKRGTIQAQKGEGPSPTLFLSVMNTRSEFIPDPELGSLRGIISELRSLSTSLEWQGSGGSARARAESELVNMVLNTTSQIASEQAKVASGLEREVEMFRDTMNNRLEYYRQLQQISDTVAPYDEESVGKPLDDELFDDRLRKEGVIDGKISALKAKRRYLIHIRDDSGSDESSRICVICQMGFETGVLTICGHKYCKDCLRLWWRQHRTCPTCKKRLKANDFHQITYKPQDFVVQEEKTPAKIEHERSSNSHIYTDISSGLLKEIKNIDLTGSFGTKVDTLARHILWLRDHDPGAQSVVFSQYKNFLEVLGSAFSHFKIGYSSIDNKDGIESFKSDPAVECFLLHAKAHSSGLNLVNATHVFLCEPLINTAIELQAIARVHRIGQHQPTTVWMYLVSDTVEQSIYDLSVSRRLEHIIQKEKEKDARSLEKHGNKETMIENITETAIDSANSMEIEDAALSKLMAGGASGGELVKKDDLWQCLFGNPNQRQKENSAEGDVHRFLRGEAAEKRREAPTS
ncbi:hypothetical protein ASPWEDRAFT_38384 [Aspergillus wentii DTO 134E9]|uniref:RING-type domain-containing protein n=1 Tax=Aspergillus wentii DTO 134E9 TaxID=1073089 RepID=A0A1L9RP80_ASPWE|nr:uncharacterized protein ASPWEDRAFT_38384 [Aspergillus wentii DTO 134E9]KAI9923628.1 hypothetical protein MW887_008448 [Aspergillus wentii]OJJ36755.1 hypothetical protein ASPWEDRAFT_38384 [Aspergillus wentii DTO 134E9]